MTINLTVTGDSITAATSYVNIAAGDNALNVLQLANAISFTNSTNNFAVPGYMISDLVAQASTVRAQMAATGLVSIFTVMIGHNDIHAAVDVPTALASYLDSMKAPRVYIGLCTILPDLQTPPLSPPFNVTRNADNVIFRTWVGTHCDFIIDLGDTSTTMGADNAPANPLLYNAADHIHPTAMGREILGPLYAAAVNNFFLTTIPKSAAPVFGRF